MTLPGLEASSQKIAESLIVLAFKCRILSDWSSILVGRSLLLIFFRFYLKERFNDPRMCLLIFLYDR